MKSLIIGLIVFIFSLSVLAENDRGSVGAPPENPSDIFFEIQKDEKGAVTWETEPQSAALMRRAQAEGFVPVIVHHNVPFSVEGTLSDAARAAQRAVISKAQESLFMRMAPSAIARASSLKRFESIPYTALEVTAAGLQALIDDPEVLAIFEDGKSAPALDDTIPQIGADYAHSIGSTGSGEVIAILDTGIEKSHSFLTGKIISEACYSHPPPGATALCPGGATSSTATNSGLPCTGSGCDHGTHVAGIAAGSGSSFSGVAEDAQLVSIQVYYRAVGGSLFSSDSDQILAMERVYALRNTYSIAAVNLSLGTFSTFSTACDTDPRKSIIDNLRSAGIATTIASGNSSSATGVSKPACISSAVTVGAVSKADSVPTYSNSASLVDVLAPGGTSSSPIQSSVLNNQFGSKSGTSMAAPHVAGMFAIFSSRHPTAGVSAIESHMINTGTSITDTRNGIVKPRINVEQAILEPSSPPTHTMQNQFCWGFNTSRWSAPSIKPGSVHYELWGWLNSNYTGTPALYYSGTLLKKLFEVTETRYMRIKACTASECSEWKAASKPAKYYGFCL